jgi:hypothetical protein
LDHSSVVLSGSSAFVSIDPQIIYDGTAWLDARAVQFTNCTVTGHGSANPPYIEVTPDIPAIADIPNLTAELAGKALASQVLTNVPSGATFEYPQVWTSIGNNYTRLPKLHFKNFAVPALNTVVGSEGYGAFEMVAQPSLTDVQGHGFSHVSGTTSLTGHLETTGRIILGANNDPMGGQSLCMKFARPSTPSHYHYLLNGMSTTSNADNFLRFDCRKAASGHNYVFRIDATPRIISAGACLATAFTTTSDASVKEDVRTEDLSAVFDAVECKSYVRTDKPDWPRRVGFIAQHVQSACQNAGVPTNFVQDASDNGQSLLGLDYSRMCCILWSKLKQVEARLANLESP